MNSNRYFIHTFSKAQSSGLNRSLSIAMTTISSFALSLSVQAATINDGTYVIRNQCSNQYLGLSIANPNPWSAAIVQNTTAAQAVKWQVNATADGSYIVKAAGTNSALQTSYGKTDAQTPVDLWTYLDGASQRWRVDDMGNGLSRLTLAAALSLALDLKNAGNGSTDVWTYADNGTCAQRWAFETADANNGGNPGTADEAFAMAKKLGRGINMGNVLEATPTEGSWGLTLNDELFDKAKEAGFATVRLPVRWSNYAQTEAPYTIKEDWFKRVDYAISSALSRNMNIVINMHHYRQLSGENLDNGEPTVRNDIVEDRFVAMWQQIAQRYKDQPKDRVIFELYNEPNSTLTPQRWNPLLARALTEVRKTNADRFVVIGPTSYNSADALNQLQLPDDKKIIVTIHNYNPFRFTHQGASWAGSDANNWIQLKPMKL
jgi:hypothetical protein